MKAPIHIVGQKKFGLRGEVIIKALQVVGVQALLMKSFPKTCIVGYRLMAGLQLYF